VECVDHGVSVAKDSGPSLDRLVPDRVAIDTQHAVEVVAAGDESTASHQQVPNPRFFLRVQGSRRSSHPRRSGRKDGPAFGETCAFSVPEEGRFANGDIAATLLPVP